jgi:hypothetical protein
MPERLSKSYDGLFELSVSMRWLRACARLGGKALQVGLLVKRERRWCRSNRVVVDRDLLEAFGIRKDAARRALDAMEREGLVRTVSRGRSRVVEVLERDSTCEATAHREEGG